MEWKHTESPVKKKFWIELLVKKDILIIFLEISIDFFEKVQLKIKLPHVNFSSKTTLIYWMTDVYIILIKIYR